MNQNLSKVDRYGDLQQKKTILSSIKAELKIKYKDK